MIMDKIFKAIQSERIGATYKFAPHSLDLDKYNIIGTNYLPLNNWITDGIALAIMSCLIAHMIHIPRKS